MYFVDFLLHFIGLLLYNDKMVHKKNHDLSTVAFPELIINDVLFRSVFRFFVLFTFCSDSLPFEFRGKLDFKLCDLSVVRT